MMLQGKKENVERIQRMQDYQRERLREEVGKKMKRADIIKQQKKESVVERLAIQSEIDAYRRRSWPHKWRSYGRTRSIRPRFRSSYQSKRSNTRLVVRNRRRLCRSPSHSS
jgi:hypothetical protein